MEKKDTLSSCSESEEQQMQLIQDKSKESCMVSFQRLHSHLKRLSNNDLKGSRTENGFGRAFATLFGQDFEIFTGTMFLNMDQLQKQLDNNEFQEIGSMASFKVLETQFQMFINSQIYLNDEYIVMTRNYFLQYTQLDIPEFCGALDQFMEFCQKSIDERACIKWNIRPIDNEEPMAEVQTTADDNVSATGQQHTEQHCYHFIKDFSRMEAHCVNLELKYQNQVLKEGQQGQFLNVKSNEAKVKNDIDAIETINIELEHKVAKLLKENETLKRHYKEMFDSIKTTRAKNIEHTTSLIANNDKFKVQLQEKGFAIVALKNELRKLTENSVNTKFAKPSILGKPVLQPHRNQFFVRQPTAFKSDTNCRIPAEAEYRSVANVVAETAWLRNLLLELHAPLSTAT
ncbi:hypothetical protein Tco_1268001, partial [Tanacetum coccineum]